MRVLNGIQAVNGGIVKVKIDKIIRVMCHPYEINIVKNLKVDEDLRGECQIRKQVINLTAELPYSQMVAVLFHELFEAYGDYNETRL